jgi:hypothetical protein
LNFKGDVAKTLATRNARNEGLKQYQAKNATSAMAQVVTAKAQGVVELEASAVHALRISSRHLNDHIQGCAKSKVVAEAFLQCMWMNHTIVAHKTHILYTSLGGDLKFGVVSGVLKVAGCFILRHREYTTVVKEEDEFLMKCTIVHSVATEWSFVELNASGAQNLSVVTSYPFPSKEFPDRHALFP